MLKLSTSMSSTSFDSLTVVDVYDVAADIGKEFEFIIDRFGADCISSLMPKVITTLEQLEYFAVRNEKENAQISDLQTTVTKLHLDRFERNQERTNYEKDLAEVEECWQKETKALQDLVARLQSENQQLRKFKEQHESRSDLLTLDESSAGKRIEELNTVILDLQGQLSELKSKNRALLREQKSKEADLDAMVEQLDRLSRANATLRYKSALNAQQSRALLDQRTDLETELCAKEQQISVMKGHLNRQQSVSSNGELSPGPASGNKTAPADFQDSIPEENSFSLEGKLVIDLKDPNRPRFTLNELRQVLSERNELKSKLISLEEEIRFYKPKPFRKVFLSLLGLGSGDEDTKVLSPRSAAEDDSPVQGPLPREPYEKSEAAVQEDSGIRKLFRRLFASGRERQSDSPSPSQHHEHAD